MIVIADLVHFLAIVNNRTKQQNSPHYIYTSDVYFLSFSLNIALDTHPMCIHNEYMRIKNGLLQYWQYAHIYNRGVDKRIIFKSNNDRSRFMLTMRVVLLKNADRVSWIIQKREKQLLSSVSQKHLLHEYGPPIVDLLAFCFMPNHFHIVLRSQTREHIAKFTQRLSNSYTRYFNTKYKRKGCLFESKYQIVPIESDEQLIHVIRYTHTNPANSTKLNLTATQLKNYLWSSLPAYLLGESKMCSINQVLSHFASIDDFWKFTKAGINKSEPIDPKLLIDTN